MKNMLFLLFPLLILSCNDNNNVSQNNSSNEDDIRTDTIRKTIKNLEGLGVFKINQTTIKDLEQLNNAPLRKYNINQHGYFLNPYATIGRRNNDKVLELIQTELIQNSYGKISYEGYDLYNDSYFIEGYRLFHFFNYEIGKEVIGELRLLFYNDTLMKISLDESPTVVNEICNAFKYKYGEPVQKQSFASVYLDNYEESCTDMWDGGKIIATYWSIDGHISTYFVIYDKHQKALYDSARIKYVEIKEKEKEETYKKY